MEMEPASGYGSQQGVARTTRRPEPNGWCRLSLFMGLGAFHASWPGGRASHVGRVPGIKPAIDTGKVVDTAGRVRAQPDRANDPAFQALATMSYVRLRYGRARN